MTAAGSSRHSSQISVTAIQSPSPIRCASSNWLLTRTMASPRKVGARIEIQLCPHLLVKRARLGAAGTRQEHPQLYVLVAGTGSGQSPPAQPQLLAGLGV